MSRKNILSDYINGSTCSGSPAASNSSTISSNCCWLVHGLCEAVASSVTASNQGMEEPELIGAVLMIAGRASESVIFGRRMPIVEGTLASKKFQNKPGVAGTCDC